MSLFTKLRDFAKPLIGAAAGGIAGSYIGQPAMGASLGASLMGSQGTTSAPGMPDIMTGGGGAMPGGGGGMQPTAGVLSRVLPTLGRYMVSARGIVSTMAGKLVGVMKGTKIVRNAQIADLAKRVGIEATAAALGITVVEVAQLIAAHLMGSAARRKRGRGISARDVRTTRRTIHKIRSIEHSLQGVCRPRAAPRRGRTIPAAFVRQG